MKSGKFEKAFLAIVIIIAIVVRLIPIVAIASLLIDTDDEQYADEVIVSLPDYSDGHEWVNGFFQDFTIYSEYKYDDEINQYFTSEKNIYFKPVDSDIRRRINLLLDDYEEWVSLTKDDDITYGDDLTEVYRFDRSCIDDSDWYYCDVEEFENLDVNESYVYASYDLYYYDSQSRTLYYMHNNI